jgi:hypothetical protein
MALRLYAATTSAGKLRDFRTAALAHSVAIEPLPGIERIPAPEEDGDTFLENAATKAVYYSRFAPGATGRWRMIRGWKWTRSMEHPAYGRRVLRRTPGLVDSPDANDNTDVWNNMVLLQRIWRSFRLRCGRLATGVHAGCRAR